MLSLAGLHNLCHVVKNLIIRFLISNLLFKILGISDLSRDLPKSKILAADRGGMFGSWISMTINR
jgi:hypothetical protein